MNSLRLLVRSTVLVTQCHLWFESHLGRCFLATACIHPSAILQMVWLLSAGERTLHVVDRYKFLSQITQSLYFTAFITVGTFVVLCFFV